MTMIIKMRWWMMFATRLMLGGIVLLLSGCATYTGDSSLATPTPTPSAVGMRVTPLVAIRAVTATLPATATATAAATVTLTPSSTATATATPLPPTATPGPTACGEQGAITRAQVQSKYETIAGDYRVYLPPCYTQQEARRYPVVYLLHGGDHRAEHWEDIGIGDAANALIAAGTIPPLIIVLPDGRDDFGARDGDPPPFAAFMHDQFIPYIDSTYRTVPDQAHRAIGGISLGGAWALLLAERYPSLFAAVGAHSPAIGSFNDVYPDANALAAAKLRLFIDVGSNDSLRQAAADLNAALTTAGADPVYHVYPGGHVEAYWSAHLDTYLAFYTQAWQ